MKPSVQWIDVAKGIAMLGIIAGHLANPLLLRAFIYSVSIPLFFVSCGDAGRHRTAVDCACAECCALCV